MAKSTSNHTGFVPGQVETAAGNIELNVGRETLSVEVQNLGDRPVQIGSHYHFFEVNDALSFERDETLGFRLNIPAGTATRFEPGQLRTVELVEFAGEREIYGFQGKVMGKL
ncbi:MAG: urease subunit beta [Vibrionaceae bacterium]|nr:urease subunit beta [Vibrionaceae bacterium]